MNTLDIPKGWLKNYCKIDVLRTTQLFIDQREQLDRDGLLPTAFTRNILTPVLWEAEVQGRLGGECPTLRHLFGAAHQESSTMTGSASKSISSTTLRWMVKAMLNSKSVENHDGCRIQTQNPDCSGRRHY